MNTAPPDVGTARLRRARAGRRLFFGAVSVFLLLGASGAFGVRTVDTNASGGGYELALHHAAVSRGGLATPWSLEIRRTGGFDADTVSVAATAAYFDAFDENGFSPEPGEVESDGDRLIWTFAAPPQSDTLTVSLDARIEPGVQMSRLEGETSVLEGGRPVASVRFSTFVMP